MMESLVMAGLGWAAYKGLQQYIAFKEREARGARERQERAERLALRESRHAGRGESAESLEWELVEEPPTAMQLSLPAPDPLPRPTAPAGQTSGTNRWLFCGLCLLYILCPIDLIPDVIPGLGWGDDAVALFLGIQKLMRG
jgi:hypothetical protein